MGAPSVDCVIGMVWYSEYTTIGKELSWMFSCLISILFSGVIVGGGGGCFGQAWGGMYGGGRGWGVGGCIHRWIDRCGNVGVYM